MRESNQSAMFSSCKIEHFSQLSDAFDNIQQDSEAKDWPRKTTIDQTQDKVKSARRNLQIFHATQDVATSSKQ